MQMGTEIKVSHRQTTGTIYCRKYTKHDDGGGQVTARQRLLYTRNGHWIHSWDPRQNPTSHNLPPPLQQNPLCKWDAERCDMVSSFHIISFVFIHFATLTPLWTPTCISTVVLVIPKAAEGLGWGGQNHRGSGDGSPPAGSRGGAPVRGSGVPSPPEAEEF